MAGVNSGRLKKAPKLKSHGGIVATSQGIDRMSYLPDNILHHILSLLDTKSLVQTSLLSKRWGRVWKEVPVLNFSNVCFKCSSSFEEHVIKILSLRSDSAAVSRVNFKVWSWIDCQYAFSCSTDLFDRVMKYAASNGHRGSLRHLSISHSGNYLVELALAASIKAHHHHHQSLKTLNLESFSLELDGGSGSGATLFSGFNQLTNLELHNCCMTSSVSSVVEPFVDLPCLKHLRLVDSYVSPPCLLKVSGPGLLDLQIHSTFVRYHKFEVFAPKLKSLCFRGGLEQLVRLNLPSLDHAKFGVRIKLQKEIEAIHGACMRLLPQLHNVKSFNLTCFLERSPNTIIKSFEFRRNST
ncbi:unnamed protein product [Linum trigynum]|uniref:F-box domain-containing protein n=1 Tax=Linum trigynum TaxID=586398 RepID=A0AAV2C866_9ROSI